MKKLLPFLFILVFVTVKSQDQITLKFIRPSIPSRATEKILITIQSKEYIINDGSDLTINVLPDYTTSLKIDSKVENGPQTNYYLESSPNQTYFFEVGLKKTGIYIKQISRDFATQAETNKSNEGWNNKLKVDRKDKSIGFTAEKTNETQAIRDDWMKKGGAVQLSSQLLTMIYFRSDMSESGGGIINGYGYGFSMGNNQINLKVPQFKTGLSKWSSFNFGSGIDFNTYAMKYELSMQGVSSKMNIRNISFMFVGNIGYTFGLGKFLDESNWKGMAFTIKYRPTLNMTIAKTEMTMVIAGQSTTSTDTKNTTTPNFGGFGFDWEFSNFTSSMNKIAPPPKMKFSFFLLPPIKGSPLFISFSLGVVYYKAKGSTAPKKRL
ncbi:MAG: hypothetical protein AB9846_04395 [Tenuifilaceae bacterium]